MLLLCLTHAPPVNGWARPSRSLGLALPSELDIAGMKHGDLIAHRAHVAVVLDDIVGSFKAGRARCLRIQDRARLLQGGSVAGPQPADLELLVAVDDKHTIELGPEILLDEQRDDQDLVRTTGSRRARFHRRADRGMRQSLEIGARLGIRKHDVTQCRAVEMPVRSQDRAAKTLHQALQRRLTGLHDLACNLVGVDDGDAEGAEELGRGGLAAGDSSGEADAEHSGAHGSQLMDVVQRAPGSPSRAPDRTSTSASRPRLEKGRTRWAWRGSVPALRA